MRRTHNAPRLLKVVNNEPWASVDDHEPEPLKHKVIAKKKESLERKIVIGSILSPPPRENTLAHTAYPSPARTNGSNSSSQRDSDNTTMDDADVYADPIGSSDEEVQVTKSPVTSRPNGFRAADAAPKTGAGKKEEPSKLKLPASSSQENRRSSRVADKDKEEAGFKKPATSQESGRSSPGSGVKRSFHALEVGDKVEDKDEDDDLPDWMPRPKRTKQGSLGNIHSGKVIPPRRPAAYGRMATQQRNQQQKKKPEGFQAAAGASPRQTIKATAFKILDIDDIRDGDSSHIQQAGSSSPLSSVRGSPAPGEDDNADQTTSSEPHQTTVECAFCGHRVDKFLYEDFQDQHHLASSGLLFKWKRRFCQFHKRQEAGAIWRDRSYPTINWSALPRRMRRHNVYLVDVLRGRVESHYREAMREQVKPGLKGTHQAFNAAMEDSQRRPGTSAGYYGPKGQKIMMDHIIQNLSDDIRSAAKHDQLVASSGVQGGVSGFVQAVLVPHLAELLIREDLDLDGKDSDDVSWSNRAREVIAESGEVGEILWPEEKEVAAKAVEVDVVDLADD